MCATIALAMQIDAEVALCEAEARDIKARAFCVALVHTVSSATLDIE